MLNHQLIRDFFVSVNRQDLPSMGRVLTEDAVFYFPKTRPLLGRERIIRFFSVLFRRYPELSFSIQRIIVEGPHAAVHWKNRGKSRKNNFYENEGVTVLEGREARICFISDFFKDTERF